MKKVGPRHTYAERLLMKQVAKEFTKKWKELRSGTKAARQLGVNPKSFYKYAHGVDLPRVEVLQAAHRKWKIDWNLLDSSTLFRTVKPQSAEQMVLPFLRTVHEEDVEIVEVIADSDSCLRVRLKINFATSNQKASGR